jgi:hypothetical protein
MLVLLTQTLHFISQLVQTSHYVTTVHSNCVIAMVNGNHQFHAPDVYGAGCGGCGGCGVCMGCGGYRGCGVSYTHWL